jgi:hypothetical protein
MKKAILASRHRAAAEGHRQEIRKWCGPVPVLDFNSGRNELNLTKEYFAEQLADTCSKVSEAAHGSKTMFMAIPELKFLDAYNYLAPGTSYDARVKAYGCKQTKSWFPYE